MTRDPFSELISLIHPTETTWRLVNRVVLERNNELGVETVEFEMNFRTGGVTVGKPVVSKRLHRFGRAKHWEWHHGSGSQPYTITPAIECNKVVFRDVSDQRIRQKQRSSEAAAECCEHVLSKLRQWFRDHGVLPPTARRAIRQPVRFEEYALTFFDCFQGGPKSFKQLEMTIDAKRKGLRIDSSGRAIVATLRRNTNQPRSVDELRDRLETYLRQQGHI